VLTTFAGGALFGSRSGSSPATVIALHGWRRSHVDFARFLEGLDGIAVDLPGFGATPPPTQAMGAAGYADAVEPLLAETAERVVLVGHSFGGRVAVHLAARRPDRVRGLVLTGVPLLRRAGATAGPPLGYRAVRWLHRHGVVSDARMEALREGRGSADYRAASGVMREVLVTVVNETYEEQLAAISTPVELVWARHDDAAPLEVAERAQALLAHAHLTVLDEPAHHDLPIVAAGELRAALDRLPA
jgi:pimeloyl-ACP methyl ester carboxylesterase